MQDVQEYSRKIKQEGDRLLGSIKLLELLQSYGEVLLGGSYSYDLMVDRDLDFEVAVPAITPELRTKVASTFASQPWAYKVTILDRVNFEPHLHLHAPRGLYLGLIIPFASNYWNVDVWFMVAEHISKDDVATRLASATREQKDTMLRIKYDLMNSSQKQKGVTSTEVYKAVLDKGINTANEFLGLL